MATQHLAKGSALPPVAEDRLRLYRMKFCPFVHRTLLVLEYKNVPHEVVFVNLKDKPDWLFERNPYGTLPIIEYKGHYVYESGVCNEYLEEAFPASAEHGSALLPSCPFERAAARLLMLAFDKIIGTFFGFLKVSDAASRQERLDTFHASLQKFEKNLADDNKPFFGGTNCGMVDFHLWPFFERFDAMSEVGAAGVQLMPADQFPRLTAWLAAMSTLNAVKKTRLSTKDHSRFLASYRDDKPDYDFELAGEAAQ